MNVFVWLSVCAFVKYSDRKVLNGGQCDIARDYDVDDDYVDNIHVSGIQYFNSKPLVIWTECSNRPPLEQPLKRLRSAGFKLVSDRGCAKTTSLRVSIGMSVFGPNVKINKQTKCKCRIKRSE